MNLQEIILHMSVISQNSDKSSSVIICVMCKYSIYISSFTCIMCNISFPEVEILQEHMSRTHLGAVTTSTPEGSPTAENPNYTTPSTSQQTTAFPSPSGDNPPAAQGSPYSQQPSTSSPAHIFPRPASSPSGSRAGSSAGTARVSGLFISNCR